MSPYQVLVCGSRTNSISEHSNILTIKLYCFPNRLAIVRSLMSLFSYYLLGKSKSYKLLKEVGCSIKIAVKFIFEFMKKLTLFYTHVFLVVKNQVLFILRRQCCLDHNRSLFTDMFFLYIRQYGIYAVPQRYLAWYKGPNPLIDISISPNVLYSKSEEWEVKLNLIAIKLIPHIIRSNNSIPKSHKKGSIFFSASFLQTFLSNAIYSFIFI